MERVCVVWEVAEVGGEKLEVQHGWGELAAGKGSGVFLMYHESLLYPSIFNTF